MQDGGDEVALAVDVGGAARDRVQAGDDDAGDDERQPVEVERDVDRAAVQERHEPGHDPVDQGQQGEEQRRPGTAEPYVVARLIWLACSSWWRGTRFGTVASLAGPHTRLTTSTSTVTTKTHHSVPTNGIVRNSAPRT